MLEQHAQHVFALSTSPHRQRSSLSQQPPRSILKKPSLAPPTPPGSISPSSLPSLAMSPTIHAFALPGYRPQQWTVVSITRARQSQSSSVISSTSEMPSTSLTVTLLYTPTETMYAWPFNLSSPDAKGVCYETHSTVKEDGAVRMPPDGTMSTSLRVLADVIRCWIRIRRQRSALCKGPDGSNYSGLNTPGSSVDEVVDNDEVIDEIVETLRLIQFTPLERSIHLLRQVLPEQCTQEQTSAVEQLDERHPRRPPLKSSNSHGSDSDQDSRHRSDSSASSRASTVEADPDDHLQSKKPGSPMLRKINTTLQSPRSEAKLNVPQIRLVEATPQEAEYEERDRILESTAPAVGRNGSFDSWSMDTVHEEASEDNDSASVEATPTCDSGEVTFIKIHPCDRRDSESLISPRTFSHERSPPREGAASGKQASSPLPSTAKIFFRDPFKRLNRSSSKSNIRVETVESGSPDSLLTSTIKETSRVKTEKRSSFEGLRSMFGGQSKSQ